MEKINGKIIIFCCVLSLIASVAVAPIIFLGIVGQIQRIMDFYSPLIFIDAYQAGLLVEYFMAYGISFIVIAPLPIIPLILPKKQSQFGDASFAKEGDIRKADLIGDADGIIIGKYKKDLLRFGGQQFISLGAPTRSGKGVGIVIPNLLTYRCSAVVQDIKQECFDFTSKYREQVLGQKVYLFDPFSRRTHRYNPLGYIKLGTSSMDNDLMDFGNILYPTDAGDSTTKFFNSLAQSLFIGLAYLYQDLTTNEEAKAFLKKNGIELEFTMFGILQLSEGFKFDLKGTTSSNGLEAFDLFKQAKEAKGEEATSYTITGFNDNYALFNAMGWVGFKATERLQTYFNIDSENTRSGVMSSFNAPLMQYKADDMRFATSAGDAGPMGDFNFYDLRKQKMTIYVGITPDKLNNARDILNLFWQQLILLNTQSLPQTNPELKYPVMLLMDEFTASGYLGTYLKGISFIAGYCLRSLMIYQSHSQLVEAPPKGYGQQGAATLLTNHACQIYYTPREEEDAKKLSAMLGDTTIKTRSKSWGQAKVTGSENEAKRPLMLPQEVKAIDGSKEIIMIEKTKPIMCNKAFYYSDSYFYSRFVEVSPSLQKFFGLEPTDLIDNYPLKFMDDVFLKREGVKIKEDDGTVITDPNKIREWIEKQAKERGENKHFKTYKIMKKDKVISYERYLCLTKPLPQKVMESAITAGETRIKVPFQSKYKQEFKLLSKSLIDSISLNRKAFEKVA